MTKDKEKEEVAPQQSVEATQDTNTEANPYAGWMSSVGDRYVQQMNNVAAEKAEYEALMQNMRNARDNNRSVRQALLQEQKPTYDYDKEKRERNKAAVKAFGDMLSAFTAGAHAYGKNGAGVVPTLAENSPLKEIEKINTMQEEYRKRNEAWKELDVKMRSEEAKDEAEAAAKLATAKGKDLDEARKAVEKTGEAIDKGLFDMATAEQKAAYDYAKWIVSEEAKNNRHQQTLAARKADSDSRKDSNSEDKAKEDDYDKVLADFDTLFGVQDYDITSISTQKRGNREIPTTKVTKRNYHNLSKDEKASYAKAYKDMPIMILYERYPEKAMEFAQQANKDIGAANELAEAYINGL